MMFKKLKTSNFGITFSIVTHGKWKTAKNGRPNGKINHVHARFSTVTIDYRRVAYFSTNP